MADQAAAPPAPPAHEPPAHDPAAAGGYDLHKCALDAEKAVEKLATELAHAGADKSVTRAATQMADAIRKIAAATAKQAHAAADAEPAAPAQPHTMASATDSMMGDIRAQRPQ